MNETLKRLGLELRKLFAGQLRRPLNWRMIDALETLKESESKDDNGNTVDATAQCLGKKQPVKPD